MSFVRAWTLTGVGAAAAWCAPAAAPVASSVAAAFGITLRRRDSAGVALTFDDGRIRKGRLRRSICCARRARGRPSSSSASRPDDGRRSRSRSRRRGTRSACTATAIGSSFGRTPHGLAQDLDRALEVIGDATGCAPRCYRPPYGVFSAAGLQLVRRRGWLPILWSKWGRDCERRATPASIAARASAGLAPGDVVLLHDADHYSSAGSWRKTVAAIPLVLEAVAALDAPCVSVTDSS